MKNQSMTLMKKALIQALINEDRAMSQALLEAKAPSDEFYLKLDEKAQEIKSKQNSHFSFKKAVIIIIAAALIISVMSISVSAVRGKIKGFIVEVFDDFIRLKTDDSDEKYDPKCVSVTYIPNDFTASFDRQYFSSRHMHWEKDSFVIDIHITSRDVKNVLLDNSNSGATQITIGDMTAFRTEKFDQICIVWTDEKLIYTMTYSADIDWEDITKFIDGIEYVEN